MKYLRSYVIITCIILPWMTAPETPRDEPTPDPVAEVCQCCLPAQEPDWECADWQAVNGKHPDFIKDEWNY